MQEFKSGQRVKVEFEGEISYVFGSNRKVQVRDAQGRTNSAYMEWVTLLDPANWPPQVGDIWEAEGREYYIQSSLSRGLVIRPDDTMNTGPSENTLKARNPVLVRRRGQ